MTDSTSSLGNSQAVIDSNGRVTLKNISSGGIDFDSITKALVQAKRTPAATLETKIEDNNVIVTDYQQMKTNGDSFNGTLDSLRGSTSSFTKDVFDARTGNVQTYSSPTAPVGHVPSANAGDIVGISLDEGAPTGSFTIEVKQKATAHQVRSDSIDSKFDDISTLTPPLPTGSFKLNDVEIDVTDSDSLSDIVGKINNANNADPSSGVTATIISASDTEHYLVLSSDKTGTDNQITFSSEPGGEAEATALLSGLGLSTTGTFNIKNETTTPQNAIIDINGLGVDIVRQSNTINDVLDSVTIDIYKAEPNTTIELGVQPDLSSVKQGIVDFVDEYNKMRDFIDDQQSTKVREFDEDGKEVENAKEEFGSLAFESTFRQYSQAFTQLGAFTNLALDEGFQSLSQIGIKIDEDGKLEIDDTTLDERLITNVAEVEKLFSFNVTSSDPNVTFISNGNKTQPNVDGSGNVIPYYLDIQGTDADGNITGASLTTGPGGVDYADGSVTINGSVLTFTDVTGANELKIIYSGGPNMLEVNDIEITPTRGIADSFYHVQNDYVKTGGSFDDKITSLVGTNTKLESEIIKIDERVSKFEKTTKAKFIKTEQAMALSDSLLKQLEQMFKAINKSS